jgi:hypothetical protein
MPRPSMIPTAQGLPPCPHCWSSDVESGVTVIGGSGRNGWPFGGTYHSVWCNFCRCTTGNKRTHDQALADWTHIPADFGAGDDHRLHFERGFDPADDEAAFPLRN